MGCFSWMFCDKPHFALTIGRKGYLLVPADFGGKNLYETYYDGYGNLGGCDVYEEVAEWNRDFLEEKLLKPVPSIERYGGYYESERNELRKKGYSDEQIAAMELEKKNYYRNQEIARYNKRVMRLLDYKSHNLSDKEMYCKYGEDWKREIGIDIACYDEQNRALKYPIKIASKDVPYEQYPASCSDENQGFGFDKNELVS